MVPWLRQRKHDLAPATQLSWSVSSTHSSPPLPQDDVLRSVADRLRRRREAQEAAADLGTRVALHAAKNERARELRKAEVGAGRLMVDVHSTLFRVKHLGQDYQITCCQLNPDLRNADGTAALYDSST